VEKIQLGKTQMMITPVGFGGIPIQRLTEEAAIEVVKRCLDHGINYMDTANGYSTSEERIGKAIAGRRKDVIIATKSMARSRATMAEHVNLSLKRLGVDYIDLYQFHNISDFKTLDAVLAADGAMSALEEAKKAGKIRHIGVTSHQIDVAKKAVASDRFETIMFPFNFVTNEAETELIPLARQHNVGFIDMKPLAGGMLNNANFAFKYIFQFKDIVTIPGIEKPAEIDEIVNIFNSKAKLTDSEKAEMEKLKQQLGNKFCHRCDYCQPCQSGVPISTIMTYPSFKARVTQQQMYTGVFSTFFDKAADCIECGECEERCPYHLPIRDLISEYYEQYEKDKTAYLKSQA
jgi:uncharacterized protein